MKHYLNFLEGENVTINSTEPKFLNVLTPAQKTRYFRIESPFRSVFKYLPKDEINQALIASVSRVPMYLDDLRGNRSGIINTVKAAVDAGEIEGKFEGTKYTLPINNGIAAIETQILATFDLILSHNFKAENGIIEVDLLSPK